MARMISVIIPSIGRNTLKDVVESASDADEIVTVIDNPVKQVVVRMNEAYKKSKGDIVVYTSDIVILNEGWREKVEDAFKRIKNYGLVSLWGNLACVGAVTRDFIDVTCEGYLFWPDYIHYHGDQELGERARIRGSFKEVEGLLTVLDKPNTPTPTSIAKLDKVTYEERCNLNFPNRRLR